jgi:hypothetical protein
MRICPIDCRECAEPRCGSEGCIEAAQEFVAVLTVCEACGAPGVIGTRVRVCVACLRAVAAPRALA